MVDSKVVVEIKASRAIGHADAAQILNYLKATGRRVGLLINLGGLEARVSPIRSLVLFGVFGVFGGQFSEFQRPASPG